VIAAKHAVQTALGEDAPLERFFSPRRTFTGLDRLQPLLRRRVTFALSHGYLKSPLAGKK
jgi:hypothetical protein